MRSIYDLYHEDSRSLAESNAVRSEVVRIETNRDPQSFFYFLLHFRKLNLYSEHNKYFWEYEELKQVSQKKKNLNKAQE